MKEIKEDIKKMVLEPAREKFSQMEARRLGQREK